MTTQKKIHGIYAITPDSPIDICAIKAWLPEISILQYRRKHVDKQNKLKEAQTLKALCQAHNKLFIINDDVHLAKAVNADGIHLGQSDPSISDARLVLGKDKIIGVSCHHHLQLALDCQKNGADYVAFGCVFKSKTKPLKSLCPLTTISQAKKQLTIAIVAIGGIDQSNKDIVLSAGADAVAMISGLKTLKH